MNGEQDDFNPHNDKALPSGLASPSQDYIDAPVDFNELLIENEVATFAVRITGDSMIADSDANRPPFQDYFAHLFRDYLAHHSEMISPTIPR